MILNKEQIMIRDMARDFAQERLAPKSAEWDKNKTFPVSGVIDTADEYRTSLNSIIKQNAATHFLRQDFSSQTSSQTILALLIMF